MSDSSYLASSQLPATPIEQLNQLIEACETALIEQTSPAAACQRLGDLLQGLGRFQESMFWHTMAREKQPDAANLYASLGRLCAKQGIWERAIRYYQQATQIDPTNATAYRNLANLYAQQGQRLQEVEARYQAVNLRPDWATPRNQLKLAQLLLEVQQTDRAIACYRRAIELEPESFQLHYNLAVVFTTLERWDEAIAAYDAALALNPEHAESCYGRCKVAEQQSDLQDALKWGRRAIELNPQAFAPCHTVGTLLLKLGRWSEAAAIYQQAIQINPEFAWSYHNYGYARLKQGNWTAATTALQQAIQRLPDSLWTYCHLGEALSQQERWDGAIEAFLAALRLQFHLPEIHRKLGYAVRRYLAADLEQAIEQYQHRTPHRIVGEGSQDAAFYAQLAAQLQSLGQLDGAYFFYRLALHLQPSQTDWYAQLAPLWQQREQLNQQIQTLRQAIDQSTDRADLRTQLGNLLADQGEDPEAITLHRQSIVLEGWHCADVRGYCFTHNWFTPNLPIWTKHLKAWANQPVTALQIGGFEGISVCWLLDYILTHRDASLTCIDRHFLENFAPNLERTGAADKVIARVGHPHQLLPTLPEASFDLIYVDLVYLEDCSFAEQAQRSASQAWQLLKPNGLIILDDYGLETSDPTQAPRQGIDAFLAAAQPALELLHRGYQLIGRKPVAPASTAASTAASTSSASTSSELAQQGGSDAAE